MYDTYQQRIAECDRRLEGSPARVSLTSWRQSPQRTGRARSRPLSANTRKRRRKAGKPHAPVRPGVASCIGSAAWT